jgi:hypothetical protein
VEEWLTGASDCRAGASLRYLFRLAEFAATLTGTGAVLPAVDVRPSGRPAARWQAVLSGLDTARFAALRSAMPPAFRARQFRALTGQPANETTLATLNALIDAQARDRLTGVGLVPRRRGRTARADTATEAWLGALTGEPEFDADPGLVADLAGKLADWRASAESDSPVRVCLRLRSPDQPIDPPKPGEDDGAPWRLEFLLQAVDEPSVLVTAAQVWSGDAGNVLHRWVDEPEDTLLAGLGRASLLFRDLESALREVSPRQLELDLDGAYRFLTSAPALDAAGFGVLLPSWWCRQGELSISLVVRNTGAAGAVTKDRILDLNTIVDYRWELALGEERLTETELVELAHAKVPLVRVRGRWVHVNSERLAAGLAFLRGKGSGRMSVRDALLRVTLGADGRGEGEEPPLPVDAVVGEGWLPEFLSGTADTVMEPVTPPAGFTATLRPYQQRGVAWLAFLDKVGLGACLADDMGLGKTVQVLALEALSRADGRRAPTIVVCPMTVVGNWQREAARFTPDLSVHVHHGADRKHGAELAAAAAEHDLVITTYPLVAKDIDELSAIAFDRVVLDEAQNVKNSVAQQARAVRKLSARHRIALTGTPVENRLAELWAMMDFANPGVLGTVNAFRARYAVPIERDADADIAARLRRITQPFVLRRLKTDPRIINDLPDKIEMRQWCNLTTEQASLYKAVVDEMLGKIDDSEGIERRGLVLAAMSKLKQVCNHPAHLLGDGTRIAGRSGKLARLEEILAEAIADGDKIICFTQFAEFGGMLVPHLSARFDTEVLFLHGGTGKKARDRMVERFQAPDGPSIFLLSLRAGGTGLNLTAANQVVHIDRWWNPAVEDQATDRAFRIGQRRDVQVRKMVCIGTIEEKIDRMIEEKKALARLAVGAGEGWLTELSTTELRDLVSLSEVAADE